MKKNPDFIIIPHQLILDENLQPLDRILYGVIYWLVHLKGEKCTASNATLRELCGVKNKLSIANSLSRLEKNGYILRRFLGEKQREEIIPLITFKGVSSNDDRVSSNDDRGVSSNDEQKNKSIKEENINNKLAVASATADAKEIAKIINLFKCVSPLSYKDWFGNKTERKAVVGLLEKMPIDKLEVLIVKFLPKLNIVPYIPKDSKAFKPSELLRNLDKVIVKIKELQQKRSQEKINIEI